MSTEQGNFVDQLRRRLRSPPRRSTLDGRKEASRAPVGAVPGSCTCWSCRRHLGRDLHVLADVRHPDRLPRFHPVGGLTGSEWVGLDHITRFVESYNFWPLLRNTIVLAFYELIAGFPIPIILALALNAVRQKYFSRVVQLITYAPNFISVVVVVGILVMLLDPQTGIFPHALSLLGIDPPAFLTDPGWFRHTYVWSGVWQTAGFSAIIYLAALSSVRPSCTRPRGRRRLSSAACGTSTCRRSSRSPWC